VVALAVVCAVLVYVTFTAMSRGLSDLPAEAGDIARADAGGPAPRADLDVRVTAARWEWRFDYPREGIAQVGTGTQIPTLVVPVGDVRFALTSLDVVHAFFVPYLRFKRDAFPGRTTRFTLRFAAPGDHPAEGECAEFCGLRHAYMQFNVRVLRPAAFRAWARARRSGAPQGLTPALGEDGRYG
jgi:cytochrome c oxidase subunit 2